MVFAFDNILFDKSLNKLLPILEKNHIRPNDITLLNLSFRIFIIFFTILNPTSVVAPVCLIIFSQFLDNLDGSLARHTHSMSKKGAVFDIITDSFFWIVMTLIVLHRSKDSPLVTAITLIYATLGILSAVIDTPIGTKLKTFIDSNVTIINTTIFALATI